MDNTRGNKNKRQQDGKKLSFKPIEKSITRKKDSDSGDQNSRKEANAHKSGTYKKEAGKSKRYTDGKGKSYTGEKGKSYAGGKSKSYTGGKKSYKPAKTDSEIVRLNKHIAAAGICSRREADELIKAGLIMVNGKVITEMGVKVGPGDEVRYNGERLRNEKKVYLVLNKPKDYVTTVDDPHAAKTVMELIKGACHERIYPVGRLDRGTTGVLLFTNDGELTKRLTHPSFNKKKIYHVHLNKNMVHSDLVKISEGVELDDGVVQADAVAYSNPDSKKEVGIEIHSGKNRVIRRMFEKLDYRVTKLDRVYFAGLTKKSLSRGKWRFLSEKEIKMLKMNAFE